jgi:hypothetical protein
MQTETSNGKTLRPEQAFSRALQAQMRAWIAAKPDRRSKTDDGVLIVRRRRRNLGVAGARPCRSMSMRGAV